MNDWNHHMKHSNIDEIDMKEENRKSKMIKILGDLSLSTSCRGRDSTML